MSPLALESCELRIRCDGLARLSKGAKGNLLLQSVFGPFQFILDLPPDPVFAGLEKDPKGSVAGLPIRDAPHIVALSRGSHEKRYFDTIESPPSFYRGVYPLNLGNTHYIVPQT
jgi:hypothetical protein